jgi:hypothetical protein
MAKKITREKYKDTFTENGPLKNNDTLTKKKYNKKRKNKRKNKEARAQRKST